MGEHGVINTFNVVSLCMSLFQLLTSPLITVVTSCFALTTIKEKEEQSQKWMDKKKMFLSLCAVYIVLFIPILALEVIHFFPVLFEYYIYHGIDYRNVVFYLFCFNVPKLLFVFMRTGNEVDTKSIPHFLCDRLTAIRRGPRCRDQSAGIIEFVAWFIVYGLTTIVLPLVPATITCCVSMYDMKRRKEKGIGMFQDREMDEINSASSRLRCNALILSIYLIVAYGAMGGMFVINNNDDGIGTITFWSLIVSWTLCTWILLLPLNLWIAMWGRDRLRGCCSEYGKPRVEIL